MKETGSGNEEEDEEEESLVNGRSEALNETELDRVDLVDFSRGSAFHRAFS